MNCLRRHWLKRLIDRFGAHLACPHRRRQTNAASRVSSETASEMLQLPCQGMHVTLGDKPVRLPSLQKSCEPLARHKETG